MPRIHFSSEEERLQYNRERARKYREKYPNKEKERQDKWRANNPDKVKQYKINRDTSKTKKTSSEWAKNNPEKRKVIYSNWQKRNRDKINEYNKKWRENNRDSFLDNRRNKEKIKRINNPIYKLSQDIRTLTNGAFKRVNCTFKKSLKTEKILGCSIEFLINYLTKECGKNLQPSDFHRYGYHIDHIIPISLAKTEADVIKLSHYTNLQPLWWKDNLSKSNKIK